MLDTFFLQILNMSVTGGMVILFVLIARLLLKKAPKIFSYALWSVVLFRLVFPFSFDSAVSLLPYKTGITPAGILYTQTPGVDVGIPAVSAAINAVLPAPNLGDSVNPMQIVVAIAAVLWLAGISALLIYSVVSLLKLRRRLRDAVQESGNIYTSASLTSPFVMGLFRAKIYLPAHLAEEEKRYILLHEQTHIKRLDHVVKIVSFFVLCLHWFNPLVWLAFFFSGRDMELSCDEAVIKKLGSDVKKDYSSSLLSLATGRRIVGGTPLAFGEGDTKSRIQNVLNYKKPAFWVIIVSVIAVVAAGIGLAANPKPSRHFAMTGMQLTDLQPENITEHIAEITKVDVAELEMTADDFGLLFSSDFSWVRSGAIRFVFSNQRNVPQTAQLRIFPEESDFFVTEPTDLVPSEGQLFKLQRYLEALRYLPQEAIAALCEKEPQRYAIALAEGDRKRNSERCIYYDRNGVTAEQSWWIRLDIIPLYGDGAGFNGKGSDTISLYYGDVADTVAPNAMRPMVMVDGVLYLDTGKEVAKNVDNSSVLGEITSAASASEKPTENGQCNFNSGVGAKYATYEDGMAVFLDHKWFFFEKETDDTVSIEYTMVKLGKNGEVLSSYSLKSKELADAVLFDALSKSAAWEGVDVSTLEEYYLIRQNFPEAGEVHDYYAYRLADGTAAIQIGTNGRYSILSGDLYLQLVDSFKSNSYLFFWLKPDEPPQLIGDTAANVWLKSFMNEQTPAESRISDYEITDVTVISGEPKIGTKWEDMAYQYVVQVTYNITTATEQYLSAADGISGKGSFQGLFRELCVKVKASDGGGFQIVAVVTGGGEQEFLKD